MSDHHSVSNKKGQSSLLRAHHSHPGYCPAAPLLPSVRLFQSNASHPAIEPCRCVKVSRRLG
jgi:hypothetical protein